MSAALRVMPDLAFPVAGRLDLTSPRLRPLIGTIGTTLGYDCHKPFG